MRGVGCGGVRLRMCAGCAMCPGAADGPRAESAGGGAIQSGSVQYPAEPDGLL